MVVHLWDYPEKKMADILVAVWEIEENQENDCHSQDDLRGSLSGYVNGTPQ